MQNYRLLFPILLFFVFSSSILSAQENNYYRAFVTPDNLDEVLNEAHAFYLFHNGPDFGDLPNADEAKEMMEDYLEDLFDHFDIDEIACNAGLPYRTDVASGESLTNGGEGSETFSSLSFEWLNENIIAEGYFAGYLDLRNSQKGYIGSRFPSLTLTVPGETPKKLYALNARCGTTQSGYYIIIVEKDLNLHEMPHPDDFLEPEVPPTEFRMDETEDDRTLSVYPNPMTGENITISYELEKEDVVSLELYDGTTNQKVSTILNDVFLNTGEHQNTVSLDLPKAGVYFITLRTSDGIITKKLMVF